MNKANKKTEYSGLIYDPIRRKKISGKIVVENGVIINVEESNVSTNTLILPGLIDSHVHLESSMLTPQNFSRTAARHGTIAVVADPHEIANVGGMEAIDYFIENAKQSTIKIFLGAPSCVPASPLDDCFQPISAREIEKLISRPDIYFLSEMMNFPGVINNDIDVLQKINSAFNNKKPIDGHAPGLSGDSLKKYVEKGISTDHESFTIEEAREKLKLGMKILIREGSAAKNFEALHQLITEKPDMTMFCTDDCHPDDLITHHINKMVKRAIRHGHDIFDILRCTSVNPVEHYKLKVGLLQVGDPADFILVDNLEDFNVVSTIINGRDVLNQKNYWNDNIDIPNYVFPEEFDSSKLNVSKTGDTLNVIEIVPNELVTKKYLYRITNESELVKVSLDDDLIKLVVVNRYNTKEVFTGFIKGFHLKRGAFAASIAHDSHHIIAAGCDDFSLTRAINYVINNKGGIVYCNNTIEQGMALPIYGIISNERAEEVAHKYQQIVKSVKENGVLLDSPFMTLSFMALTVIPHLKISPKGLFDVDRFNHISLFKNE